MNHELLKQAIARKLGERPPIPKLNMAGTGEGPGTGIFKSLKNLVDPAKQTRSYPKMNMAGTNVFGTKALNSFTRSHLR